MLEKLRLSLIAVLDAAFSLPVYGEAVPQNQARACIILRHAGGRWAKLTGGRMRLTARFEVRMTSAERPQHSAGGAAKRLSEALEVVEVDGLLLPASAMEWRMDGDALVMTCAYPLTLTLSGTDDTDAPLMGKLTPPRPMG